MKTLRNSFKILLLKKRMRYKKELFNTYKKTHYAIWTICLIMMRLMKLLKKLSKKLKMILIELENKMVLWITTNLFKMSMISFKDLLFLIRFTKMVKLFLIYLILMKIINIALISKMKIAIITLVQKMNTSNLKAWNINYKKCLTLHQK
jgi:hypothetical protein